MLTPGGGGERALTQKGHSRQIKLCRSMRSKRQRKQKARSSLRQKRGSAPGDYGDTHATGDFAVDARPERLALL